MPQNPAQSFSPPSVEQVRRHLERHPARGPSGLLLTLPFLLMVVCVVMIAWGSNPAAVGLAVLLLIGFSIFQISRRWWERGLQTRATQAQELALLRHWAQSLRVAWRSLPSLSIFPDLHWRTVAVMAHDLDQLKAYEPAIAAYDYLIERLPPQHAGSIQFRIQRAMAQFALDRLTDGDETLRRLRGQMDEYQGTPAESLYRLAMLVQQVRTNHYADAVAESGKLMEELRPLGIEAGYGYALLALSFAHLAAMSDAGEQNQQAAQTWWSRATMLVPAGTLIERFPDLEFMTR